MKPEVVVFDIGNVLIEWQPERFYDAEIGADRRKEMFAELDLHAMNERVDMGENFYDVVHGFANENPAWRAEIQMWHDRWVDMASPVIDRSVRLMKALQSRKVPVFSLTNFGIETYDMAATHYPFLREFDRDHISGHMKMVKPDAAIYEALEDACGVAPEALLFTDDRAENIEAAAKRGWQTHLFENPAGWADTLIAAGLLTKDEAA